MARLGSFLALFAVAFAGCAGQIDGSPYVPDEPPSEMQTVVVWVQDHPRLLHNVSVLGCDIWYPEGIRCSITADERYADVRVYAHDTPCMPRSDGTAEPNMFRTVMGHEIGHQLGVWAHVPESCSEAHVTHPTGGPLCGQALMNPMYDSNISFMTALDHLAFEMRDRDASVLEGGRPGISGGDPICVFTGSL